MIHKKFIIFTLIAILIFAFGCEEEKLPEYLPETSTQNIESITSVSAVCRFKVISDGNSQNITTGVVWDTTNNPVLGDCLWKYVTQRVMIGFINQLEPNTKYYVRAFATNTVDTTYGEVISFTTLESGIGDSEVEYGEMTDSRDGNTYKTVQIGSQVWMAENLKYLPSVNYVYALSYTEPRYYVYKFSGENVDEAIQTEAYQNNGVVYNWAAAMNSNNSSSTNPSGVQGACPCGWHIPSASEWIELETFLTNNGYNYDETIGGGGEKIAKSLASTSLWEESYTPWELGADYSRNNTSGFSGIPTKKLNNSYWNEGNFTEAWWWSSSEDVSQHIFIMRLGVRPNIILDYYGSKAYGFSIRCIQD